MTTFAVVSLILAIYLFLYAFIVDANKNLLSKIVFKFIPFIIGLWLLLIGLSLLGVTNTAITPTKTMTVEVNK